MSDDAKVSNNSEEGNIVVEIIDTIKKGDVLPYKLINQFLTAENGDTMNYGRLDPYGELGNQLRSAVNMGIMPVNLCAETIGREEEIHKKLLRILKRYSHNLINSVDSVSEAKKISEITLRNYYTIVYGRDNIPMDENGNLPKNYQDSINKFIGYHSGLTSSTFENLNDDFSERN